MRHEAKKYLFDIKQAADLLLSFSRGKTFVEFTADPLLQSAIVWLSDLGANTTPRFDPKTDQFTVRKSTSRNASMRQILGRPGELWLPVSGADKLVVIRE